MELRTEGKLIISQATRAFFCGQKLEESLFLMEPHIPFLHTSNLPALANVRVAVRVRRKEKSAQVC